MKEQRQKSDELKETMRKTLSPRHHAMLYAYIVRSCRSLSYDDVEQVIRHMTVMYGMRRGRHMAGRAAKDNMPLTALNYEVYQEWQPFPGDMDSGIDLEAEEINVFARKCPWYDVWQTNGLLEYGKPYCRHIDEALVRGFNPDIVFETAENRTNGGRLCDFYYRGLKAREAEKKEYRENCSKIGSKGIKSWDFHIGDLYDCARGCIIGAYGEAGAKAMEQALEDYRNMYGQIFLELLLDWKGYDFESVDDYLGIDEPERICQDMKRPEAD